MSAFLFVEGRRLSVAQFRTTFEIFITYLPMPILVHLADERNAAKILKNGIKTDRYHSDINGYETNDLVYENIFLQTAFK